MNELNVLHRHLYQEQGHLVDVRHQHASLLQELLRLVVYSLEVVEHLLLYFVGVGLVEVEMRHKVHLELEEPKELALFVYDLLLSNRSVGNLL